MQSSSQHNRCGPFAYFTASKFPSITKHFYSALGNNNHRISQFKMFAGFQLAISPNNVHSFASITYRAQAIHILLSSKSWILWVVAFQSHWAQAIVKKKKKKLIPMGMESRRIPKWTYKNCIWIKKLQFFARRNVTPYKRCLNYYYYYYGYHDISIESCSCTILN